MKAIALIPRKPGSLFLGELPAPELDDVPDGRAELDEWLWEPKRQSWVRQAGLDNVDRVREE